MQLTGRCCRAYKDLLYPCCTRNEHGQLTSGPVSTEVAHMHITWRERRWLRSRTCGRYSVDARSAALRSQYIERFAIGCPGRGRHEMFIANIAIRPVHACAFKLGRQARGRTLHGICGDAIEVNVVSRAQLERGQER